MYLPDINLWLALVFPAHVHHGPARTWFDSIAESCNFCRYTQSGFLRMANNPAAFPQAALTQDQAWALYDEISAHALISFIDEPSGVESLWRGYTELQRFAPKTWNDAYLAAFAQAASLKVVTFDHGFSQYANADCVILSAE